MQIAILDTIGLPYTESTVRTQGLGGSESAAIFMAQELQKLGMRVTLYNSNSADTSTYEQVAESGVIYRDLKWLSLHSPDAYDVLISSRSVFPFADNVEQYGLPAAIRKMRDAAAYKVLWMHDTFCQGDDLLEQFVVEKKIDKIFTLSDFHTSYVTTCTHGPRRNFEVLKKHIFVTRNGIRRYHDFVDISKKDPNLYVYNASVTKGLLPLVNDIWPKVKGSLPLAKLMVIGGYYRNGTAPPDAQEIQWRELSTRSDLKNLGVTFTGVIPQWQVADILAKAKFTIYPAAFPETFGISTLESLAYNTPVLTNRFGALEETAIDDACYKIDYPIVSNSLFPHIDAHRQTQQFVDMVLAAARDTYLYSQKAHTCSRCMMWLIGRRLRCNGSSISAKCGMHIFLRKNFALSLTSTIALVKYLVVVSQIRRIGIFHSCQQSRPLQSSLRSITLHPILRSAFTRLRRKIIHSTRIS
jgi:glycosyltransferase involved in cell wall biosynthesis